MAKKAPMPDVLGEYVKRTSGTVTGQEQSPEAAAAAPAPAPATTVENYTPPKGFKLVPAETKTKRLQLVLKPTVFEGTKQLAAAAGISVNEYVSRMLAAEIDRSLNVSK